MKQSGVYYCLTCKKWRGTSKKCPECQKPTEFRKIPELRGDFYYIHDVDQPLPRVTSVLNVLAKPELIHWAAKTAAQIALTNITLTAEKAASKIYEIKNSASSKGSEIHKLLQNESSIELDKITSNVQGYIQGYLNWKSIFPHQIIAREQIVYSKIYHYAGTLDLIISDPQNKIWLIDIKTGKNAYPLEHSLQLAAYKQAVIENGLVDTVDYTAYLHLKPNGTFTFSDVKGDFEVFLACLKIYNWQLENKK